LQGFIHLSTGPSEVSCSIQSSKQTCAKVMISAPALAPPRTKGAERPLRCVSSPDRPPYGRGFRICFQCPAVASEEFLRHHRPLKIFIFGSRCLRRRQNNYQAKVACVMPCAQRNDCEVDTSTAKAIAHANRLVWATEVRAHTYKSSSVSAARRMSAR